MVLAGAPSSKPSTKLNQNQVRGFWAAWGGWALDGMDASFYLPQALPGFFMMVFLLGVGGANFAMYTLWISEQYTTECRGSAIGFTSSIGRFVGCGMVFLVGAGVASYGSLGVPVAMTALAFAIGLFFLPLAEETRGKPLPI